MTHRVISATLLLLCAAMPAYGADLRFSLGGAVEYDDNVFRTERNKEDDVLFRLRPGVEIYEDRGQDLDFSLGYAVPIEFAVDNNEELQDEDHIVDGTFTYRANDRLEFFGSDDFGYLRSGPLRERVGTDGVDAAGEPTISEERERVTRNEGQLGMVYRFTPRTVSRLVASSDLFDPTRSDRSRVYSVGAIADLQYTLTLKHQVGGGAGYTFQEFDDRDDFAGSTTDIYRVFGSWRWTISETLSFDVRAGPSYLRQKQDSAPLQRNRFVVPFTVVSGPVNAFDRNGVAFSGTVGPGSLAVPSYLVVGGTGVNCNLVEGQVVASGCAPNIVLNSSDPTDQSVISAIVNRTVPLVNSDPGGDSGSSWTVFAEASLVQRWTPTLATALRYARQQGNASGLGSTVVEDAVSLSNTWDFRERWQLAVRGDWVFRESVFESERTFDRVFQVDEDELGLPPGTLITLAGFCQDVACTAGSSFNADSQSDIETERWSVAARITHRLFRDTVLYGQVRYDEQESRRKTLGRTSDFENLLLTFGVRHSFEPIKLW